MLKKFLRNLYIKYTILFGLCTGILYVPLFLIRRGPIGHDDSFNQEYPLFIYIGKYIRDFLTGTVRQFDFRIGLGDDVIAALNWHGFGDVFQVISALFPVAYSEFAYALVMVLKFYLCGITFLFFSKRYLSKHYTRVSGALLYAFSMYGIVKGLDFWVFLNPIITFPLIIYGIDEIRERKKKICYPFIVGLCVQALSGFYFLYMEAIMAIVYFIGSNLCDSAETIKVRLSKIWKDGLLIMIQALIGVGLGAVILVPAAIGYLTSSRTGDGLIFTSIKDLFLYEKEYYLTHLKCLIVPEVWDSIVTVSVVVFFGVIVAFTTKKMCKQLKAVVTAMLIGFALPIVGSMMNGFSYSTDRWYFGIQFFLIVIAMVAIEQSTRVIKTQTVFFYLLSLGLVCYNIYADGITLGVLIRSMCLMACIILLPVIWNHKMREQLLFVAVFGLVVMNGLFVLSHSKIGGSGYAWNLLQMRTAMERMQSGVAEIDRQDRFERHDIYQSSLANAMVMDYYGTTEYFSTSNGDVSEFYRTLNIAPGVRSATWILKGLDGREELLSMLSVGQYNDFYMKDKEAVATVVKNENFLPLGFTYSDWMNRETFETLSIPEMQSTILKTVVLEKNAEAEIETISDISEENKEITCRVEYRDINGNGERFTTKDGSYIRVYLEDAQELEHVYVQLTDFIVEDEGMHEFYVGNKNLQLRDRNHDYYMGYDEFWVYVTELFEEEGNKYFDISFQAENTFSLQDIHVFSHKVDVESIEKRREHVLENVVVGTNEITGTIATEEQEWLFMSIPYSSGWRAYVDGEETEVWQANIGFSAIVIPGGEHEVRFVYRTPGIIVGAVISVVSAIILLVLGLYGNNKKRGLAYEIIPENNGIFRGGKE